MVDGMSNDGTRSVAESFAARFPQLRVLANEKKITPAALNLGIASASGSVIVRMDAHVEYPATYITSLVNLLDTSRRRQRWGHLPCTARRRDRQWHGR